MNQFDRRRLLAELEAQIGLTQTTDHQLQHSVMQLRIFKQRLDKPPRRNTQEFHTTQRNHIGRSRRLV